MLLINIVGKFVLLQAYRLGFNIHDYKVYTLPGRIPSVSGLVSWRYWSQTGTNRLRFIPPIMG